MPPKDCASRKPRSPSRIGNPSDASPRPGPRPASLNLPPLHAARVGPHLRNYERMVGRETLISKTSAQGAVDGRDTVLRVIAGFKFFKATMLLALSFGAFRLLHKDVGALLEHWIEAFKLDPGN